MGIAGLVPYCGPGALTQYATNEMIALGAGIAIRLAGALLTSGTDSGPGCSLCRCCELCGSRPKFGNNLIRRQHANSRDATQSANEDQVRSHGYSQLLVNSTNLLFHRLNSVQRLAEQ